MAKADKYQVEDSIRAAKCPDCGQFMDKVQVVVIAQISEGLVKPSVVAVTGWVCAKCCEE